MLVIRNGQVLSLGLSHQFSGEHARRERPLLQARQVPLRSNARDEVAEQRYLDPIRANSETDSNFHQAEEDTISTSCDQDLQQRVRRQVREGLT